MKLTAATVLKAVMLALGGGGSGRLTLSTQVLEMADREVRLLFARSADGRELTVTIERVTAPVEVGQ